MDQKLGPVETYLSGMERDLAETLSPQASEEVLRELRDHLEESVRHHTALGHSRTEAEWLAVQGFGERAEVSGAVKDVHCPDRWSGRAIAAAGVLTLGPVLVDLFSDATSIFHATDYRHEAMVIVPALIMLGLLYPFAKAGKMVSRPLTAICFSALILWTVAGGFLRGVPVYLTSYGAGYTVPKFAAYRAMREDQRQLAHKKRVLEDFQQRLAASVGGGQDPMAPVPFSYKVAEKTGYDPLLEHAGSAEVARKMWRENSGEWIEMLTGTVEGLTRNEEYWRAIQTTRWPNSVIAQAPLKMTLFAHWLLALLGLNAIGVAISNRRPQRKVRA